MATMSFSSYIVKMELIIFLLCDWQKISLYIFVDRRSGTPTLF